MNVNTTEQSISELQGRVKKLEQTQVKIGSGTLSAANTSTQVGSVTLPDGTVVANVGVVGNYIPEAGQQVHFLTNGTQPIIYPPTAPILSAPPAQVSGVTATPGIGSLVVRWAAIIEADVKWNRGYYQVQTDTVNTFNSGNLKSVDSAGTSCTVPDLVAGTTYFIRVRAVDYVGQTGAYSTTTSAVPNKVTPGDATFTGIVSVGTLPTLPNGTYPVGTVVFLTTDGKLYRNFGNVWTAAVPTVDLTGQITTTQITDNSISTVKLQANSVTSNEIAANTITAGDIAANTITAGQIAASTITSNEIAANTIQAGDIQANTITAAEIAANAVDTAELNANSVTAAKVQAIALEATKYISSTTYVAGTSGWKINADGTAEFGNVIVRGSVVSSDVYASTFTSSQSFTNIVTNPGAETNTTGWTATNNTLTRTTTAGQFRSGVGAFKLQATGAGDMWIETPTGTSGFPVVPGKTYSCTAFFKSAATSRTTQIRINWFNSGGSAMTSVTVGYPDITNAWRSIQATGIAPAGAAFASIRLVVLSAATNEIHYMDDILLCLTSSINSDLYTGTPGSPAVDIYSDSLPQIQFYMGIDGEGPGQIYKVQFYNGQALDGNTLVLYSGGPTTTQADHSYLQLDSKGQSSGKNRLARIVTDRFYLNDGGSDLPNHEHSTDNQWFGGTSSTTSTLPVEPSTPIRITFTKRYAESYILVTLWGNGLYCNSGLGTTIELFVNDGTSTTEIGRAFSANSGGVVQSIFGSRHILGGAAAGSYTFQWRWLSTTGATINMDGNSSVGLTVKEVSLS